MGHEGNETGLDYSPCRYGRSRTVFRGPPVSIDGPFTAVIGGSEVFGKYVETPFVDKVAERTGRRVANLGLQNGGVDAFALDRALLKVAERADTVVVQAMGAQNLSNRFYTVHPRRNDRFVSHSAMMEKLFPDVDFTDFNYTRHLISALRSRSPKRFAILEQELAAAWVARMRLLLARMPGQRVLLWIENNNDRGLGSEPLFVSVDMMQELEPLLDKVVHVDVTEDCATESLSDLIYPETERASAALSLPPSAHARIGEALSRAVRGPRFIAA